MFAPSLPLLLAKVLAIFALCFLCGWAFTRERLAAHPLVAWSLRLTLGAGVLNFCCAFGSLFGATARVGLGVAVAWIAFRVTHACWRRRRDTHSAGPGASVAARARLPWALVLTLSALCAGSYLAPFLTQGTSGFYSRGGGDHNTYLSLSDWYVDHRFWEDIPLERTYPPQPYFEVNMFTKYRQRICWGCYQPIANQYVAAPFIAWLPGSSEETYTASVAVYVCIAGWAVVALLVSLLPVAGPLALWGIGIPIMASNLLQMVANMQSIPYLIAIALSSGVLTMYHSLLARNWAYRRCEFLALAMFNGALMALYPHLFVFAHALVVLMIALTRPLRWQSALRVLVLQNLAALLIINVLVIINFQLIFAGAGAPGGMLLNTPWASVLAAQSGLIDFGTLREPGAAKIAHAVAALSLLWGVFFAVGLKNWAADRRKILLGWCAFFALGILVYNFKNFSWQMIRFSQFGHLLFVGVAGYGLSVFLVRRSRTLAYVGLALLAATYLPTKYWVLRDVIGADPGYQTEFRDAEQLRMVQVLANEQRQAAPARRLVYYLGSGFGVDHAGATAMLRPLSYLAVHGYDYGNTLDWIRPGARIWDLDLLTNALVVVRPMHAADVVTDNRATASRAPRWTFSQLQVFDGAQQIFAQVMGEAWNAPLSSPPNAAGDTSFRYLKAGIGALVIWSHTDSARAELDVHAVADADGATLRVRGQPLSEAQSFALTKNGDGQGPAKILVRLDLKRGPNVVFLEMSSARKDAATPWALISKIQLRDTAPDLAR